jgi:hypothetical protein
MKLRGYITVFTSKSNEPNFIFTNTPEKFSGDYRQYTFIIEVPHNLPELKTVDNLEEVK